MKNYLTTALVLFVTASSLIVPTDMLLASNEMTRDERAVSVPEQQQPQRIIYDGLLWWLCRAPHGYGFAEFFDDCMDFAGKYMQGGHRR